MESNCNKFICGAAARISGLTIGLAIPAGGGDLFNCGVTLHMAFHYHPPIVLF